MKNFALWLAALCLSLTLLPSSALAAGNGFKKVNTYIPFADTRGHWSEMYVRVCVETGLMQGTGCGFAPEVTLTNGETAAIAARVLEVFSGNDIPAAGGSPWYQVYVDYLAQAGVTVKAPMAYATRQGFFEMLSAVLPDSELAAINRIKALPDTNDPTILKFYNAGILTGMDQYGTFEGSSPLTRSQCAAMVARIADPNLRRVFTPAGQVPAAPFASEALVMTVDGMPVTYEQFVDTTLSLTEEVMALHLEFGLTFQWEGGHGVDDWRVVIKENTKHSLAAQAFMNRKAAELGCPEEELALAFFGAPTQAELEACALEQGIDRSQPDADEILTDIILEEKLNTQVNIWVKESTITTTPVYDKIDPQELWELYYGY